MIPVTHLSRLPDGLIRLHCSDTQLCKYEAYYRYLPTHTSFDILTQLEDIVAIQQAHYQSHLNAYFSSLRLRFRGEPDIYTRNGNKSYKDPTRSHHAAKEAKPNNATLTSRPNGTTKLKGNRDPYNPFPGVYGL